MPTSAPAILVVDDDPPTREALAGVLRGLGSSVVTCGSGEEALAWLADGSVPALVVLDLVLPGISGEALLRHLRGDARLRAVPVVLVTGVPPEKLGRVAVDAYLPKPVAPARLAAVLRAFLESPRQLG